MAKGTLCGYCGEVLPAGAMKCRFCGEQLREPGDPVRAGPGYAMLGATILVAVTIVVLIVLAVLSIVQR